MGKDEVIQKLKEEAFDDNDHIEFEYEGVRGPTDEHKHFALKIVSEKFEGKNRIQRSKMVYNILGDDINNNNLHALKLNLKTPSEV